jgi:hypothetical protein
MSAGSAAPSSLPQEPLSPSSFAHHTRATFMPFMQGLPLKTAVEEPPRRRVLIAWEDSAGALHLQRVLREMGYRVVGPAGSCHEAGRLISPPSATQPPLDCALIHIALPGAVGLARRLAEREVPIVWLAPGCTAVVPAVHAPILGRPFDRAALEAFIEQAERAQRARRLYAIPPPQSVWPRVFPQL